jgi:hypothetical protein
MGQQVPGVPIMSQHRRRALSAAALFAAVAIGAFGPVPVAAADPLEIGETGERNGDTITLHAIGEGSVFCYPRPELPVAVPPCEVGEGSVSTEPPRLLVDITYCVGAGNPAIQPLTPEGPELDDLWVGSVPAPATALGDGHGWRYPGDDFTQASLSEPIAPGSCDRGFLPFSWQLDAPYLIWGEVFEFDDAVVWQIGELPPPTPGPTLPEGALDPCGLLTEQDVERVLGVEAEPGTIDALPFPDITQTFYCTFGTEPFELQVFASASEATFEERAEGLRQIDGQVVEEIDQDGLHALWVYSETLAIHSNRLNAPMEGGWLGLEFWPIDDAAQAVRTEVRDEQREQAIELARIALGIGPVASVEPNIQPSPSASGEGSPVGDILEPEPPIGAARAAPGEFVASIPTLAAISTDPPVVLQSALLALAVIFLMPFPAQLFNSTVEEHRDEIRGWFAPVTRAFSVAGRGLDSFWRNPVGIGLFLVVSAVLYALLDPAFGLAPEALITLFGLAIGIVVVTILFAIPTILSHRRHGDRPVVEAIPGTLLVGIACVAVSRLADFQPGYLYGLVIGLAFARELDPRDEGRSGAAAAALMLTAAAVAWFGLGVLVEGGATGLVAAIAETILAAVMVAGLEGVVFGLLPLRFLPGEPVYAWNRVVWGALLGIGVFAFFHILINPSSGYLADSSRTSLLTVIGLLVGFGVASVGFWAYFRYRPARAT